MLTIGSHVGFNSKDGLLGSLKEALSYHANTFMFYTGAPQNTIRKEIDEKTTKEAHALMEENNINIQNVICHAPYIINLANRKDEQKWHFSIDFLKGELKRCDLLGIKYLVLHPGSAVGLPKEEALQNIKDGLNEVLKDNFNCLILLETMAGKGTECGTNLEEIKYLVDNASYPVGVCLDTCHLNDSGIDMSKFDDYLNAFDEKIGLDKVKCIHINDSKNVIGSHKDRHENIGYGTIGFENILNIIYNERLKDVPKILETPYVGETLEDKKRIYPPYLFEIKMIREKKFDENLFNHIHEYYK